MSRSDAGSSPTIFSLVTISRPVFSSSTCSVRNHCSSATAANAFSVKAVSYSASIWWLTSCSCSSARSNTSSSEANGECGAWMARSCTSQSRASRKSSSFIACMCSSWLCSRSQRAAPVNFWRSHQADMPR